MDFWASEEKVWIASESVSSPRDGPSHVATLDNSQGQDCASFKFPVLDPVSREAVRKCSHLKPTVDVRLLCGKDFIRWDSVDSKGPMSVAVPELVKLSWSSVCKPRCLREISKCPVLAEFLFKALCMASRMCLWISLSTCKPLLGGFLFKAVCPRSLLKVPTLLLVCSCFIRVVPSQKNPRSHSCMIQLIKKILLYPFDS